MKVLQMGGGEANIHRCRCSHTFPVSPPPAYLRRPRRLEQGDSTLSAKGTSSFAPHFPQVTCNSPVGETSRSLATLGEPFRTPSEEPQKNFVRSHVWALTLRHGSRSPPVQVPSTDHTRSCRIGRGGPGVSQRSGIIYVTSEGPC